MLSRNPASVTSMIVSLHFWVCALSHCGFVYKLVHLQKCYEIENHTKRKKIKPAFGPDQTSGPEDFPGVLTSMNSLCVFCHSINVIFFHNHIINLCFYILSV
ncbi:hypothetical protein CHARACLAT_026997 [Characodon lateralis]|uniref:Secreted protein n=1 Tax=Characodon lateralis TaxID=208331 RepID=A0ABU7F086_9TELE|nr:hypothetical protein [Characodon lateralis]